MTALYGYRSPPSVVHGHTRTTLNAEAPHSLPLLAALLCTGLLVPFQQWWAVQVLLFLLLLTVPGIILLRALRVPGAAIASFFIYIPCASLVVLLGSGLIVDLVGLFLGFGQPLRTVPLLIGIELCCLILLATAKNAPADTAIPWQLLRPTRLLWPLVLPLGAAVGASRLNSGHGPGVAVLTIVACLVVLIWAAVAAPRLGKGLLAVIVYATDLAVMLQYSLRGASVYGFDISTEYYDLQWTISHGIWHTAHPGDAYGAMLSVTVMPSELHFLTGVSGLLVFKILYPAISALFPVGIFGLARAILNRRWAFIAAALFVVQGAFAQSLTALARQEIALTLFAGVVAAMFDTRIRRGPRWTLVGLLSVGMVVSHYSTTYVTMTFLFIMLVLQLVTSLFDSVPRVTGAVLLALIVSLAGAYIWYGPVTHSAAAGLGQVAQSVGKQGLDVFPNQSSGHNLISTYLQGNSPTPISGAQYEKLAHAYYAKSRQYIKPLPDANRVTYALRDSSPRVPPIRLVPVYNLLNLGSVFIQQLIYALGGIGALIMLFRRKMSLIALQCGLLSLATVIFLVLIRVSGTLAVAYNQDRALLQAMAVLAIPVCFSLQRLAGQKKLRVAIVLGFALAGLSVLFVMSSGLDGVVQGGGTATNLANSGEDFERYYTTTPELAAASWLGLHGGSSPFIYADRYAQLRLVSVTGLNGIVDVTPLTLNDHAWIYASQANIIDGRARAFFDDHTTTYKFPAKFLEANYDLVYSNGYSEVFHR